MSQAFRAFSLQPRASVLPAFKPASQQVSVRAGRRLAHKPVHNRSRAFRWAFTQVILHTGTFRVLAVQASVLGLEAWGVTLRAFPFSQ